jgi:hypothetical protein
MRPAKRSNDELLQWATRILAREQEAMLYGTVSFEFENGVIRRTVTNKSELPTPSETLAGPRLVQPLDNASG